jgi:hypothetical protein
MRGTVADLGPDRIFIFGVPLDRKVNNRFLVFMLQKTEYDKRTSSAPRGCLSGDVLEIHGDSGPSLAQSENVRIPAGQNMTD